MSEALVYAAFAVSTMKCVMVSESLTEAVEHLERGYIVRAITPAQARAIFGEVVPDLYQPITVWPHRSVSLRIEAEGVGDDLLYPKLAQALRAIADGELRGMGTQRQYGPGDAGMPAGITAQLIPIPVDIDSCPQTGPEAPCTFTESEAEHGAD